MTLNNLERRNDVMKYVMNGVQYWYSHQVFAVLWKLVVDDTFHILCGV